MALFGMNNFSESEKPQIWTSENPENILAGACCNNQATECFWVSEEKACPFLLGAF